MDTVVIMLLNIAIERVDLPITNGEKKHSYVK